MTTLLIIESPGKKAKLEEILGTDFVVRASFGHIRDLPEKSLGVKPQSYEPQYVVSDARAKKTIDALKKAASSADRVLLATDPDREGEAIAWHVADALGLKNAERITYGEITPKAVKAALAAPRPIDIALVHAQEARRVLDRLVGFQVSPALSERAGRTLSAGRVQSPAVRLVVERERAIRAFVATKHFGAILSFPTPAPWRATWKPELPEGTEYQLDPALAKAAAAVRHVRVIAFEDGTSKSAPPAPFTTSTLQQAAQTRLKMKPKKTMEVAQRLYEQGAITYMRTDSPNLSDDAVAQIAAYAHAHGLPLAEKRRRFKAKGNAQEAHEAIRPSHIAERTAGENDAERALYELIWSRAVASQLADATFAVRTASLQSLEPIGAVPAAYEARGLTLIDAGWKILHDDSEDEEAKDRADDEAQNPVPALTVGAVLDVADGKVQEKTTKAPKRYTLATLVKELEAHGIGRPSTYAAILDNITRREYIAEDKKGFLSASPIAEQIVDALVGAFTFVGLEYTRDLELDLDGIAEGTKAYRSVVADADAKLTREIAQLAPVAIEQHTCPDCGQQLRRRTGTKGPFWGCSGYPACKLTLPDLKGSPGARSETKAGKPRETEALAHVCPDCARPLRRNTRAAADDPKRKGWDFWGCSGYPTCKRTFKPGPGGAPTLTP